jgi:hypothetical protein
MRILNASPGFGTKLSEDEIKNFLVDNKHNIHLGTIDDNGDPNIHPYYFRQQQVLYRNLQGFKKIMNLTTNDIIYYCVDNPNPPYKGVRGKGKIKIHDDIERNIPTAEKIMVKYLGSLAHRMAASLMSSVKDGDSVILEIVPSYYSSWDYRGKRN